jgi:chromosome segregation ATPase
MERKELIKKLSAKLKKWDTELTKLEAKALKAKEETQAKFKEQIVELKKKKKIADKKLKELEQSGEEAWEELKSGAELVFDDLATTFKAVISKFK